MLEPTAKSAFPAWAEEHGYDRPIREMAQLYVKLGDFFDAEFGALLRAQYGAPTVEIT